jgi:hypothetical protein
MCEVFPTVLNKFLKHRILAATQINHDRGAIPIGVPALIVYLVEATHDLKP